MRRAIAVVGLVFVLAGFAVAQGKVTSSEYYPLEVGTTWIYKAKDKSYTVKVAKHEKVGDVMCARIEVSVGDKVTNTEHISVEKDGVYRHSIGEKTFKPAVCILKLPVKKGDTWKVDSKAGEEPVKFEYTADEEEIQVPAGKYKAIVTKTSEFESAPGTKARITVWYAKGVGMVKTAMKDGTREGTLELEKFTPGK
jgi:hypothetical protein